MLSIHGAVSNGAIHPSCGPKRPRWKIPWRRGVWRRAIQPRRHRGGRRAKGSDRELISNTVYFVLNFAKKAIFVVFYPPDRLYRSLGKPARLIAPLHRLDGRPGGCGVRLKDTLLPIRRLSSLRVVTLRATVEIFTISSF
jgi:hypothetical protein